MQQAKLYLGARVKQRGEIRGLKGPHARARMLELGSYCLSYSPTVSVCSWRQQARDEIILLLKTLS